MNLNSLNLILVCGLLVLAGCDLGKGPHKPLASNQAGQFGGEIQGYDKLRSVFVRNCAACHPSRSAPDWLDYEQAKAYASSGKLKQRVVTDKTMPPVGSPQATAMTNEDRARIAQWVDAGAPQFSKGSPDSQAQQGSVVESQPAGLVQQCLQCHGAQGLGSESQPKIPALAGQNEIYLYNQMKDFRWRKRVDPSGTMNDIASGLSRDQWRELASHFAQLPSFSTKPWTQLENSRNDLFAEGRSLAASNCISCHMNSDYKNGTSDPAIPVLAGQSEQYLINQLLYYRLKERQNNLMSQYASSLSDRNIEALALYFSLLRQNSRSSVR